MAEETKYEHILVEWPTLKDEQGNVIRQGTIDGGYAVISINRPNSLNSLTEQTVSEITSALRSMELDNSVRAVVLRGTKEITKKPAFSAGADLASGFDKRLKPSIPSHMSLAMRLRHREYDEIEQFVKPLIAAVDGFALGGGCELALACDIIIVTDRAKLGLPEVNRGIIPANGGVTRLACRIGVNRALRMAMFGEPISGQTAVDWGLASFIAPAGEEFEKLVHEKASWFGTAATTALYVIKNCIKFGTRNQQIGTIMEQFGFGLNGGSFDCKEGIVAFNRKVKCPVCKGKGKFEDGTKCENCGGRRKLKDKPKFQGFT